MLFRWEINYVVGLYKAACIVDERSSRLHSAVLTGNDILFVIFRPFISELQRNAFPHDSNAVDSIDDRVNVLLLQEVAMDYFNHLISLEVPFRDDRNGKCNFCCIQYLFNLLFMSQIYHANAGAHDTTNR